MNTVPVNIVGESYESRSRPLSSQRTLNLYPEINPDTSALHCWPGAKAFSTGSGVNRGIYDWNGTLYAVNGTKLVSINSTGEQTEIGTVAGGGRCVFAADGNYLYFVTTGNTYRTDGAILEANDDIDLVSPQSIAFLNSFFFYDSEDYWAASFPGDGFNISALDKGQAESVYDELLRVYTFKQQLFMLSSKSIEPWYITGGTEPPIARAEGGLSQIGIAGTYCVTHTQNALYFLGNDRTVYRLNGYQPEQVSKIAINNAIENYSTVSDCIAWTMKYQGQDFVIFKFPSEGKTWGYSELFNEWFELATGDGQYIANDYAFIYGKHLISDYASGNIYELDIDTYTDNGTTTPRERVLPVLLGEPLGAAGKRVVCSRLELLLERGVGLATGQGSNPFVMVSVSEDGGKTFGNESFISPGVMGAYKQKVEWYGFASGYEIVFKVRITDPINISITSAAADVALAGY